MTFLSANFSTAIDMYAVRGKIELTKAELEKLKYELKPHIDTELDSVIIFSSRQEKWLDKQFWGKKDESTSFII